MNPNITNFLKQLFSNIGSTIQQYTSPKEKKTTWEDLQRMSRESNAPIPNERYTEFGKPTPTPMPTKVPTPTAIPTTMPGIPKVLGSSNMLLDQPIATQSAKNFIDRVLNDYQPKTKDVYPGWKSPLLNQSQAMAEESYNNKMHPALPVLMAIAETQAMRPEASGTAKNNPYNIMNPGTQNLYDYGNNLERAVRRWPTNIAQRWTNNNMAEWRKNPTLENFVYAYNPNDNPNQELNTIMQLIQQLGI
jgi:hypothetical protein